MNKLEVTYILSQITTPYEVDFSSLKNTILQLNRSKWEMIVNIANQKGIIPLLYASLKEKHLLSYINDKQLSNYLQEIYKLNEIRNNAIVEQIIDICTFLETINIKPILLKGAAALTEHHYKHIGSRVMTDIDIYIPDGQIYKAIDILKKNGYSEINPKESLRKDWHDYRRMYKSHVYAAVELHRYFLLSSTMPYFSETNLDRLIKPSIMIENAFVLAPVYELYHSFLHSEISNENYRYKSIDIRHQQHFSQMQYKYNIDLKKIDNLISDKYVLKAWQTYCCIQNKFFHVDINQDISSCKKYLRYYRQKLKTTNTYLVMVKNIIRLVVYKVHPKSLQEKYHYKYKIMYLIYLLYYFGSTSLQLIFQKEKRHNVMDNLKHYM